MFYSHEILTSRKYGVATVWLVATLGAKSTTKKLNRKAILGVDVKKACETIIQPEAPMALRLQSNLLYGVSRVYSEQCGYILSDVQAAQNQLRALLHAVKHDKLDSRAGKIRPEQLILGDDPAFMPDMALPALDLDMSHLSLQREGFYESQGSLLDPHSQSPRRGSSASRSGSLLGLVIPTSDSGGVGYQFPFGDAFPIGGSSIHKLSSIGHLFQEEEEALIDEFDFEFDADGNFGETAPFPAGSVAPQMGHIGSGSVTGEKLHLEHEKYDAKRTHQLASNTDGDFIMQFDDEGVILPEAEAFPATTTGLRAPKAQLESESSIILSEDSTVSAKAVLKQRKRKAPKLLTPDQQLELANSDLRAWQKNYLANMAAAKRIKEGHKAKFQAKKNADVWVFGNGLGNLGRDAGYIKYSGPLSMFTGDSLMTLVTGVPYKGATKSLLKRGRDEGESSSAVRRVRARTEDGEQIGRGPAANDDFLPIFDESMPLEVGREGPSTLEDHASSVMPWNISASAHSFRAFPAPGSSSIHDRGTAGRPSSIFAPGARHVSRLTSVSPLLSRSRAQLPGFEIVDDYDLPNPDEIDDLNALGVQRSRTLSVLDTQEREFEMFGPAAAVDTQTAQSSAWVKEALAKESMNFLEYVKNTIKEENIAAQVDQIDEDDERNEVTEVSFEMLFPPDSNRMMVAAQAFHHVLTLATKNLLSVRQERVDLLDPYGDIWMGVRKVV